MSIRNRSVMLHDFATVPKASIPRSVVNRSHGHKFTMYAGTLVPFYVDEVLPGDSFKGEATFVIRFNDLLRPFLDNLFFETFYFYVPYRLVWDHWENFCGAKNKPSDTIDYVVPKQTHGRQYFQDANNLYCYMLGIGAEQIPQDNTITFNILPFRAYYLIWNEWFRADEILDSLDFSTGDGPDTTNYTIRHRMKRPDYFTNCLPVPQQGPEVSFPLGITAPVDVYGNGRLPLIKAADNSYYYPGVEEVDLDQGVMRLSYLQNAAGTVTYDQIGQKSDNFVGSAFSDKNRNLIGFAEGAGMAGLTGVAHLNNATAVTVNQLRQAFAVQHLYERDARSGIRYTEILQSHFGVTNPDLRIQRPEYLGGSSQRINVTQIPQTSAATSESPQGNLAAFSLTGARSSFVKSFSEHGVVIGLCNVRADLTYQQGLERMWSRSTRFDFYWPEFANLGEQPVFSREIYVTGDVTDNQVFGYQERWAEYRYKPSKISGSLNSMASTSLDVWTLSQKFTSRPVLNESFMIENPPVNRVRALADQPPFLVDMYMDLKCARPMPVYSIPGLTRM